MKYLLKGYFKTNHCFEGDTCRVWAYLLFKTREEAEDALIERKDSYRELSIEEVEG